MKKSTRWIIIGLIVLLIAGMIFYPRIKRRHAANDGGKAPAASAVSAPRNRALNVNAEIVRYTPLTDSYIGLGNIVAFEEVNLTFETSGKIVGIYFEEGSYVKAGTLLAKINDAPLQAQLKKLEAQVKLAQDRVFRQQTLLERDAVSQESYETVVTERDKLMADIDLVRANIAQTEIRAPFDGRLGLRYVSEGAYVSPSAAITTITMTDKLKLDFLVPEAYATEIGPGTKVRFQTTDSKGINHDYYATVYAIESSVSLTSRSLRARATFNNELDRVVPGNYASIELIKTEIPDALSVPSQAIIPEMGQSIVYIVEDGKATPVPIETGIRTASRVQALTGLQLGDTLIISGVMQLRAGTKVIIDEIK